MASTNFVNDSKKISELRARNVITQHQENSWLPVAQYNSRTDSYTNIAMSVEAITSYVLSYSSSYTAYVVHDEIEKITGQGWVDLMAIGEADPTDIEQIGSYIKESSVAANMTTYAFAYTYQYLSWQTNLI